MRRKRSRAPKKAPLRKPKTPREFLDRWEELVKIQLEASRRVDPERLERASLAREAIQVEIEKRILPAMTDEDRAYGKEVAARIRALDVRIHKCGTTVSAVVERMLPDAGPGTYSRQGVLRDL